MDNLDLLVPQPFPLEDNWRWGTVTQADPLRVRLDGDPDGTGEDALVDVLGIPISGDVVLSAGDRVWCQLHGRSDVAMRRVIVHAVPAGGTGSTSRPIVAVNIVLLTGAGSGTYTVPANLVQAEVIVQAGGGGGGGAGVTDSDACCVASGGGGGGCVGKLLTRAQLGNTCTYTIGGGGAGGVGHNPGDAGGDSLFTCTAGTLNPIGGSGGGTTGNSTNLVNFRTAGYGGLANQGSGIVSPWTVYQRGGSGPDAFVFRTVSTANPAIVMSGGGGGSYMSQPNARQSNTSNTGGFDGTNTSNNGYGSGGGGAGAARNNTTARTGGSGQNGAILIREYLHA